MREAPVPNYTAVPCRGSRSGCMSNVGQPCSLLGSCRERRLLWAAMLEAQRRGEGQLWWHGYNLPVPARPLEVR